MQRDDSYRELQKATCDVSCALRVSYISGYPDLSKRTESVLETKFVVVCDDAL